MTKPKRNVRVMYMHTVGGSPATFDPLWQIIHRAPSSTRFVIRLATSYAQILRERKLCKAALLREGRSMTPGYGFVRVEVP